MTDILRSNPLRRNRLFLRRNRTTDHTGSKCPYWFKVIKYSYFCGPPVWSRTEEIGRLGRQVWEANPAPQYVWLHSTDSLLKIWWLSGRSPCLSTAVRGFYSPWCHPPSLSQVLTNPSGVEPVMEELSTLVPSWPTPLHEPRLLGRLGRQVWEANPGLHSSAARHSTESLLRYRGLVVEHSAQSSLHGGSIPHEVTPPSSSEDLATPSGVEPVMEGLSTLVPSWEPPEWSRTEVRV